MNFTANVNKIFLQVRSTFYGSLMVVWSPNGCLLHAHPYYVMQPYTYSIKFELILLERHDNQVIVSEFN